MNKNVAIPVIAVLALSLAVSILLNQKNATMMPPPQAPRPPTVAAGPPKATTGGEIATPGGTFRSLDKLNEYAVKAGCPPLVPEDPAGKLIDLAECLGAKALPAGQTK